MEFTTGGHARGCVVLAYANAIPLGSPTLSKLSPHRPPEGLGVEGEGWGEGGVLPCGPIIHRVSRVCQTDRARPSLPER